jgi:hypothetical protein
MTILFTLSIFEQTLISVGESGYYQSLISQQQLEIDDVCLQSKINATIGRLIK